MNNRQQLKFIRDYNDDSEEKDSYSDHQFNDNRDKRSKDLRKNGQQRQSKSPHQSDMNQRQIQSPMTSQTHEIENLLNQKEQELQQINILRIQTLENIIEEKIRIIESLEKQGSNAAVMQNRQNVQTPVLGMAQTDQANQNQISQNQQFTAESGKDPRYKDRYVKYKKLFKQRDSQCKELGEQNQQLNAMYENERQKSLDLEFRVNQVSSKIEQEIKRVKNECQNLLRKQEMDFQLEKDRITQLIEEKDEQLKFKTEQIQDIQVNLGQNKQKEMQDLRHEMNSRISEKQMELNLLDQEVAKLVEDNQHLTRQNDELSSELQQLKQQSVDHLTNMENELNKKWEQAQYAEETIKELQQEFLKFREEKKLKEIDYKSTIQELKFDLEQAKKEKEVEVQHIKLLCETEKLNLKSEYEVKADILQRENIFLKEERKKFSSQQRENSHSLQEELVMKHQEIESLKNELLLYKRDQNTKDKILDDSGQLRIQIQNFKTQIEKLLIENQSLQRQVQILKNNVGRDNQEDQQQNLRSQAYSARKQSPIHIQTDYLEVSPEELPLQQHDSRNNQPSSTFASPARQRAFQSNITQQNFQKEYFEMKEENMKMKMQLFEANQQIQQLSGKKEVLEKKKTHYKDDLRAKMKDLDNLERKYNDTIIKLREIETKEIELRRNNELIRSDLLSKDKELEYLQERINRLSDPVIIKFEKDSLVQTYKKRVQEVEDYVQMIEKQLTQQRQQPSSQFQNLSPRKNPEMQLQNKTQFLEPDAYNNYKQWDSLNQRLYQKEAIKDFNSFRQMIPEKLVPNNIDYRTQMDFASFNSFNNMNTLAKTQNNQSFKQKMETMKNCLSNI